MYHVGCLETALEKAATYDRIWDALGPGPRGGTKTAMASGAVGDVWQCGDCGGYTGGYCSEKCRHCGAKIGYGGVQGTVCKLSNQLE